MIDPTQESVKTLADDLLAALEDLLADCGDTMNDGYVENSLHSDQVNVARSVVVRARAAHLGASHD